MDKKYLVSIDSGTQSTRVMIFDTQGNRLATGSAAHPVMLSPHQGWHEHGQGDLWQALCAASKAAFEQFDGDAADIVGIGLSSQRICVCITDEAGELIYNPISWMDGRWSMTGEKLGPMSESIEDPSYRYFLPYYSRANWLRFFEPEVYERAAKYLNVAGYLGIKLTGNTVDSMANNICWPYDVAGWSGLVGDEYIELMGMRREQLATIVMPTALVGAVTDAAAEATGMPKGCAVYACGGDKQCEVLGAGAVQEGQSYITLGTLSGLDTVSRAYKPSPNFGYATYLATYPKNYNYEVSLGKGFWLISWFRDNFGTGLAQQAEEQGCSIEEMLNREAEALPAGAEGLIALPDWMTDSAKPYSKGMFIGFDDRHKRAHVYRALVEGLVMEMRNKTDKMLESLEMGLGELVVGGGGSRSNFCVQAIADVFNVPVLRTREPENTSLGAAMCAAVGAGVYADLDGAIAGMSKPFDRFEPIPENVKVYEFLRTRVLARLYPALEEIMKDLVEYTKEGAQRD